MSPGELPMDRIQFHDKESVILLAYILYCLKKYTYRGCTYFVVLGGMIFKFTSTSFSPKVSSSSYLLILRPMYEILVTGSLGTSECAGECHFSANLCKRALYVTAGVIVEATRNVNILTISANAL